MAGDLVALAGRVGVMGGLTCILNCEILIIIFRINI